MRAFRFGLVFTGETDATQWPAFARRAQDAGFSTLLVADHLTNPMACVPLVTAAAAATSSLRVGTYVFDNDFRHPALLAKEVATMDVLSGGRFEWGMGAGWDRSEYLLAGMEFDPPGVRFSRFEESIGVVRALLEGGNVEHRGEHYRLRGLPGSPLPVQARIPLLIGAGGHRMIRLAAHEADIVGLVPSARREGGLDTSEFSVAAFQERIDWLDAGAAESGRADGGPERSVLLFAAGADGASAERSGWMDATAAVASPYGLVGSPDQMVETLIDRRERWGVSYLVGWADDLELLAPVVERLAGR